MTGVCVSSQQIWLWLEDLTCFSVMRARRLATAIAFGISLSSASALAAEEKTAPASIAAEIIKILPALIWPLIIFWLLLWFRKDVSRILSLMSRRIESGAPIKLSGIVEVGSSVGTSSSIRLPAGGSTSVDPERRSGRNKIYADNRNLMIVHTLHPSQQEGQVYDILIYLTQSKGGSFLNVKHVEYYFGKHWGDIVVQSAMKLNGFAIKVSAYGPFLCVAKIHFNDDTVCEQYRYIDFESPSIQPLETS